METHLQHTLSVTEAKAKYDAYVKELLADKEILARILIYAVREFQTYTVEEAVAAIEGTPEIGRQIRPGKITGINSESKLPDEGEAKFDIVFIAVTRSGKHTRIYINLEAQKQWNPGYDLTTRGIVYASRLISQQMDVEYTPDNYDSVCKTYSIWICMETPESDRDKNTISDIMIEYSIEPKVLYSGSGRPVRYGRYDLIYVVMINLSERSINSKNYLIGMLSTLISNQLSAAEKCQTLEEKYAFPVLGNISKGVNTMCNLSEGIYENGLKKGLVEGTAKGLAEGKAAGLAEGTAKGKAEGKLEGRLLMLFELAHGRQLPIPDAVRKASEFGIKDEADFRSRSALAGYDLSGI
jgi:hypothetical protein